MAVNNESANWRLFGGGGLIVAGALWLVAILIGQFAPGPAGNWIDIVTFLVLGAALLFVAFGQTGSNGAVGNSLFGKFSLSGYALGWILAGVFALLGIFGVALGLVSSWIIGVLIAVGGVLSAIAIYQKAVAHGAARWFLFAPAVWGILFVLVIQGVVPGGIWVFLVLAVLVLLTGVLYLLNTKKVG